MFSSLVFYFIPTGELTKKRIDIFSKNISNYGAQVEHLFSEKVTHICLEKKVAEITLSQHKLTHDQLKNVKVVDFQWIVGCLKEKRLIADEPFIFKPKLIDSNPIPIDATDATSTTIFEPPTKVARTERKIDTFVCSQTSGSTNTHCANEQVVDILNQMISTYENTSDKWRAYSYRKAVVAVKQLKEPIKSREEVANLRGIGDRLADKIWEIVESGRLEKLDTLSQSEHVKTLSAFTAVWGAGPQTANAWIQAGYKTIDQLRNEAPEAYLHKQQRLGLKYYEDFLTRIPREEVGRIESTVRNMVDSYGKDFITEACGSYRRGRPDCGDVDILITHPIDSHLQNLLNRLVKDLELSGFITDHLVKVEEDGNQRKYFGICKLPGENHLHRRIDIIVTPHSELACCRLYFTGSAHFTRSMRALAKSMKMSLDNHHLRSGVVRVNGEKVNKGIPLETPTEKSIFQHLGIPYREPHERDH